MSTDVEALQGAWEIAALEIEGSPIAANGARIVLAGDRFTTSGMGAEYEGVFTADESVSPKTFELRFVTGPEAGNTSYGIYQLAGDQWTMCLSLRGTARPATFATTPGSGFALQTLHRAAASAPTSEEPVCSESAPELDGEWSLVSGMRDGQPFPRPFIMFGKRTARDGQTAISVAGKSVLQARYAVDRSRTPMAMDYFLANGGVQRGIYELDGKMLKICIAPAGAPRPGEFESKPGDGRTMSVWKFSRA